jgi:hypothetical protein
MTENDFLIKLLELLTSFQFSSSIVHFRFRQYNSLAAVDRAITSAPYPNRRGERLDIGLETAYRQFFQSGPDYIQRTLLIVASGRPDKRTFRRIHQISRTMEKKHVKIFVVRLGSYRKGITI